MDPNWYLRSYRRILLDFHVADWDGSFLSHLNPAEFARNVKSSGATAATVFANTHTGLSNYPSRIGKVHARLAGRDALGELIDACRTEGLAVVVYYCTIYCDWYWETHPEARVVDGRGKSEKVAIPIPGMPHRFCVSCPNNSGYRGFVAGQLEEICSAYDFDGIWIDMTLWPTVCYCRSCRERFRRETGSDLPTLVDWQDPKWVSFQRRRQEWLVDFARLIRTTVQAFKPGVTIAHQSGPFGGDWLHASSVAMADQMDWLSADLYRDRYDMSFMAKIFYSLSHRQPFEHIGTWCYPNIFEHVEMRTQDELELATFSAFANGAAKVYIDAIDPDGAVHGEGYRRITESFRALQPIESFGSGRLLHSVGVYFSYESNVDFEHLPEPIGELIHQHVTGTLSISPELHRSCAVSMVKSLIQGHVPYGVLTKKNLADLDQYQIVVLPNVGAIGEEEASAFRAFVEKGGALFATKLTSLFDPEGGMRQDFLLSDLFGLSYRGMTKEIVTYVAPTEAGSRLLGGYTTTYPITYNGRQVLTELHDGAEVLAHLLLPFTDPVEGRYACILTNPPGRLTTYPSLVLHRFGRGRVVYSAAAVETLEHYPQRAAILGLVRSLARRAYEFSSEAPTCVEITAFDRPDLSCVVLHAVNAQLELPNVPVFDVSITLPLGRRAYTRASLLPSGSLIDLEIGEGEVRVVIPRIENYAMVRLDYRSGEIAVGT